MGNHLIFFFDTFSKNIHKNLDSTQFLSWNKEQLKLFYHSLLRSLVIAGFSLHNLTSWDQVEGLLLLPFYLQKKKHFDKPEKKAICVVEIGQFLKKTQMISIFYC